ncbi:MAG TPA: arginine--tRNA ligase [Thermoanaerobaculaceae bacterium]|nr:arginine--tRNA ligase [Thermoanaerobaculaceae bacterium]
MLETIRREVAAAVAAALSGMGVDNPQVALEVPPRRQLGDLAWAGALPLAKALRKPPRAIAEDVAARVDSARAALEGDHPLALLEPGCSIEGPGFLNFRLRRGPTLAHLLLSASGSRGRETGGRDSGVTPDEHGGLGADAEAGGTAGGLKSPPKVIVEHTNINPNKAAHIGHIRNAVLGDTLVRCLRFLGSTVEVQNYVDDTGVQVADVVVGLLFLPEPELMGAVALIWPETAASPSRSGALAALAVREASRSLVTDALGSPDFDDLCWELYPRVTRWYESDEAAAGFRARVLHAIEGGFPPELTLTEAVRQLSSSGTGPRTPDPHAVARVAAAVAEANLRCHLITMGRLGIAYDVLPHESDILHRGFWRRAFELLQAAGAIRLETDGKNAGCWVMSLADSPEFAGMADADKILVRSNGTVTYTGKDIAYQLWKLGLLRDDDGTLHDFGYRPFAHFAQGGAASPVEYGRGGGTLYRTASDPSERPVGASFGAGSRVFNVIDVRQSYPQKVVKEAIRVLGHGAGAENSVHFAYEMVALTPKAVRRLEATQHLDFGLPEEDMARPFIEMSGRRGIGVTADALLATLIREAERAIAERLDAGGSPPPQHLAERARAIAVGALRYQMARQGRNRVLAFDFDEALAFEGDTGPYLQYSAVRAAKIFEKLSAQGLAGSLAGDARAAEGSAVPDDLWELVLACARTPEMVEKAVNSLEFSLLAGHARDLAQTFHKLYHEHPVLHAEDEDTRALRRAVFRLFAVTIASILEELLGIPVPAEM